MKRTNAKTFTRLIWLPSLVALVVGVAIITIATHTHSTQADPVDCSGDWGNSGDQALIAACSDQKLSADLQVEATMAARPYVNTRPNYTPAPMLPEPTYSKEVRQIIYDLNDPDRNPIPREWKGATSMWLDGSVPSADYRLWFELFVVSRPNNGYFGLLNPTLETELFDSEGDMSQYVRKWTCPQPVGTLHITSITNPDYTNTDPHVAYPGLRSVVYFTTDSSSWPTGSFNMATQTWTLDPVNNLPNPASDDGP